MKNRFFVFFVFSILLLGACSGDDGFSPLTPVELYTPEVTSLDTNSLTVGQTLYVYGENFLHPEEGSTVLVFDGVYYWQDAQGNIVPENVENYRIKPLYDGYFPS